MLKCKYCDDDNLKKLFELETIDTTTWEMNPNKTLTLNEACEDIINIFTFIDRGYIRQVNPEDSGCMDHGDKIKINFCPFCGRNLN